MPGARLTLAEREMISRGLVAEKSFREIARELERPPSTMSREVDRYGGRKSYRELYLQGRGALRTELTEALRTGRARRRPKGPNLGRGKRGKLTDVVELSERPAEVENRAVPGHWEGDLLLG